MNIESPKTIPLTYTNEEVDCEVLILCSGFEDRAYEFISNAKFKNGAYVIIVKFNNDIDKNSQIFSKFRKTIKKKFVVENIIESEIDINDPRSFGPSLERSLNKLPRRINKIWTDISGMPTFAICTTLKIIRDYKPEYSQSIVYTSAKDYHPDFEEYKILQNKQSEGIEYLPPSMAKEMSENLILNIFSGQRTKEGQSCLALFAGYEVHRSAGVIENVNPSILLLLYGVPGGKGLDWRLDLSRQLHGKFEKSRKSAVEEVSTLHIEESLEYLEQYYEFLYDDFDLTIAPVCSKMHAVSAYLFWENFKEVQLIFPLPIGYAFDKKSMGIGGSYLTVIKPRYSLYRALPQVR